MSSISYPSSSATMPPSNVVIQGMAPDSVADFDFGNDLKLCA